ncbi:MAG TPA: sigma-70 family RNA polymerase sigma factor [Planctomycetaceae bacterium]
MNELDVSDPKLLARFSRNADEEAFSELVRRHGPLVLGVCRRILGDVHAADDAFQAVFLVLAKRSGTIHKPELLANWLYGVACRIARKARTKMRRDATRERGAVKVSQQDEWLDVEWTELKQALDEEVSQLPEKFRAPLVLCYLQGQTNAQAAEQLGWPPGSISERLAQAREMLRRRLNRRGMNLTAALLAVLLSQKVASAAVSPVLISATVQTAISGAAENSPASVVSQSILELAYGTTRYSFWNLVKVLGLSLVIMISIGSIGRSQGLLRALDAVIPGWSGPGSHAGGGSCGSGSAAPEPIPDTTAGVPDDTSGN